MDWYEENIEEPLRDLIKFLRNNGINTECSCGHNMYIQCQYIPDGGLKNLYDLIYNYLYNNNLPLDFKININLKVDNGFLYSSIDITFTKSWNK